MKHITLFMLFWASTTVGATAEVLVRSGAHESFARLVLDVAPGTQWILNQDKEGARVELVGYEDGFDVSAVFERIDRSYISDVTASPDAISLQFNCACKADVFRAGDRMIAIDVSLNDLTGTSSQVLSSADALRFVGRTPLQFTSIEPISEASTPAPAITPVPQIKNREATVAPSAVAARIVQEQGNLESLQQAQEKLAERIGLAATTGVLRPSTDRLSISATERRPQIDTRVFEAEQIPSVSVPEAGPVGGNLRITSSSDLPETGQDILKTSPALGVRCIDPALVRVQDWGADTDFTTGIATLRRALFSEFDQLNEVATVDLARRYLHYGFGAEARELLSLEETLATQHPALIDIANVMEFGSMASGNYLPNFMDCDSDVALWAILSARELQPSDSIDSKAAIRTLSSLPLHLRQHIAPALSRKLLAYGDEDGAAAALRGLERTAEPLSSAGELATAELELAQGNVPAAQNRLEDVVTSNTQQSAEALVKYVETQFDADVQIEQDIATLVEAYAIEFRDDPLGEELRRSHVLALAKSNQFDAAFQALERLRSGNERTDPDQLRSSVLELLAKDADEATFLRHAFKSMRVEPGTASSQAAYLMADRLAELGFFAEAELLLLAQDNLPSTTKNRLLRAEISIGLARPYETLAFLSAVEGEEADKLRAAARAHIGDFDAAHSLYSNLGDDNARRQVAWLSDTWTVLTDPAEPVFGATAEIATTGLDTSPDLDGMLGRVRTALDESSEARSVIEQLLFANEGGVAETN